MDPAAALKKIPVQLIVLVAAIGLGAYFDLEHQHTYLFLNSFFDSKHPAIYEVGHRFLVDIHGYFRTSCPPSPCSCWRSRT